MIPKVRNPTLGDPTGRKARLEAGSDFSQGCPVTLAFSSLASLGIISHSHFPLAQGCFEHIGHAIDSYTWGISWFGFAILMWTVRGGAFELGRMGV